MAIAFQQSFLSDAHKARYAPTGDNFGPSDVAASHGLDVKAGLPSPHLS